MSIKSLVLVCVFFFLHVVSVYSQCFASPGNPVGGTESIGVLAKGLFRVGAYYRYLRSDLHLQENKRIDPLALPFYAGTYHYGAYRLGYGLTGRFTSELSMGYFFHKSYQYHSGTKQTGSGWSNLTILPKYAVYQNLKKRFELDMGIGAIIPLRQQAQVKHNMELPVDLQSSTGNYGMIAQFQAVKEYSFQGIRIFYTARYESYLPNSSDYSLSGVVYEFGDFFSQALYFSKHLKFLSGDKTHHITLLGQFRHEHKWKNQRNADYIKASGNTLLFFSPQISYSFRQRYNLTALFDLPVYRYYNGKQLAASYSFSIALSTYLLGGD